MKRKNLILLSIIFLLSYCTDDTSGTNNSPNAQLRADPTSGAAPLTVHFDASSSKDPDGDTLSFAWDFGDGETGEGNAVDHTYNTAGEYNARLNVSDGRGGVDQDNITITVYSNSDGNTYYVSINGSDSNPGTSAEPWQTLQHAADNVSAGDMVIVRAGVYSAGFHMTSSGTSEENRIVFRSEDGNRNVIIDGENADRDIIFIESADYISIEGFKIQNAERAGMRLSYSDYIKIRNCELANNDRWGIFTDFSHHSQLTDNIAYGSKEEHGIYISNSSDYARIQRNRCYRNAACGIQINADPSMGGDGISSGCTIDSNICYENGKDGGAAINLASVRKSTISNNVLYNNYAGGIAAWDDGQGNEYGCKELTIVNNTVFFSPGQGRWCISLKNGSADSSIYNNILFGGRNGCIEFDNSSSSHMLSDYNVFYSSAGSTVITNDDNGTSYTLATWQNLGFDPHSLTSTPSETLVDISNGDPHLKIGSLAIDNGTNTNIKKDYEGDTRPQGGGYDIGADEKK
jgi:parallel beta-helix repeat protein